MTVSQLKSTKDLNIINLHVIFLPLRPRSSRRIRYLQCLQIKQCPLQFPQLKSTKDLTRSSLQFAPTIIIMHHTSLHCLPSRGLSYLHALSYCQNMFDCIALAQWDAICVFQLQSNWFNLISQVWKHLLFAFSNCSALYHSKGSFWCESPAQSLRNFTAHCMCCARDEIHFSKWSHLCRKILCSKCEFKCGAAFYGVQNNYFWWEKNIEISGFVATYVCWRSKHNR